ncbi:glycoside hydrolase family 6 protein [Streptomyces sp. NBC_00047]|uniref:glycoside hydrolase family 6 protein n=1 Tax=Streptomyces sp. NBC_00047 TaxID=2975627 RepID=UPI00225C2FCE|nr:glycoside hydrolase family 6 protein [Streptomyces sp. NBC_00047]MCX5612135.1 glycoside hydrolase family 6 protein [Streptomyces sp. NBC_00047]
MPAAVPRRRPVTVLGLLLCLAAAAACSGGPGPAPEPGPGAAAPSGAGADTGTGESPYWVDPQTDAARQVAAWEAAGRNSDAQVLRRIADRPMALWGPGGDPGPEIRRAGAGARATGRTLVLAAHNLPYRGCGPRSAGGAKNATDYRRWIGAFADSIANTKAVVILEPDAIAHVVDGCTRPEHHAERYRLLSEAVGRLKRNPGTKVYLDAGNPAWIPNPLDLVEPLSKAGLARADGFALNVSNFQPAAATRAYGAEISEAAGGKHFVVDTGRNGEGPLPGDREKAWCNPPGRALGTPPTDRTDDPLVDAYLWIKRPGESDGPCRGGPRAGTWWPDYALGLARRARE